LNLVEPGAFSVDFDARRVRRSSARRPSHCPRRWGPPPGTLNRRCWLTTRSKPSGTRAPRLVIEYARWRYG
jgi:hypothetical protein